MLKLIVIHLHQRHLTHTLTQRGTIIRRRQDILKPKAYLKRRLGPTHTSLLEAHPVRVQCPVGLLSTPQGPVQAVPEHQLSLEVEGGVASCNDEIINLSSSVFLLLLPARITTR